jgi:hypothetical protein
LPVERGRGVLQLRVGGLHIRLCGGDISLLFVRVDLRQDLVGDNMIANVDIALGDASADSETQNTLELRPDFSC